MDGLVHDKNRRTRQHGDVDDGAEDFRAAITESIADRSAASPDAVGNIGDQDGGEIAEIVRRIGDQGHAVSDYPGDDLDYRNELSLLCNYPKMHQTPSQRY